MTKVYLINNAFLADKVKNIVAIVARFLYRPAILKKTNETSNKSVFGLKETDVETEVVVIDPKG